MTDPSQKPEAIMTDCNVERVAGAIAASFERGSPDIAAGMRMDWQTWAPEARAAISAMNQIRSGS